MDTDIVRQRTTQSSTQDLGGSDSDIVRQRTISSSGVTSPIATADIPLRSPQAAQVQQEARVRIPAFSVPSVEGLNSTHDVVSILLDSLRASQEQTDDERIQPLLDAIAAIPC